ncbi:glycerophosphodiester phosphodiesterase family protein [Streptomyces sp. NBC_00340]|uniref:glycerophosphodiester phosphodiesterase n=1 Tax=Streptomyces sp. NBC_00340 TaxID=2975716 RepID=UPI00225B249F|nr:glycerophosphodiester phosphodiesterase family protein [Streptomyces sp. NBC_00340]MCX5137568.1 glycerophosphodiester phosphodiesterase family protein [Streptomyces sp. NBC_00340]
MSRPVPTIDDLPAIIYSAHRGGSGESPENTMEALRAGARFTDVTDCDVQVLGDGTLGVMHDATVDRTTSRTGPVTDFNAAQWAALRVNAGSWFGAGYPSVAVPTVADVLDALGPSRILSVEAKTAASVGELTGMILDRGLERSVLINSSDPTVVEAIVATGCLGHLYRSAAQMAGDDFTQFTDLGATVLDVDIAGTDVDIARAAEVKDAFPLGLWTHTVMRRSQRDRALALGCRSIITDYPGYVTGKVAPRRTDSLASGWGYGYVPSSPAPRPKLLDGGVLHFDWTADNQVLLAGELSGITASTFTVEAKFSLSSAAASRPWFRIHLGLDDAGTLLKGSEILHSGYTLQYGGAGDLSIYRDDLPTASAAKIATVPAGGTFAADTPYTLRVKVTATQVSVTVPELSTATATIKDSTYRGPWSLFLGRGASTTGVTAKAWDIAVT